MQSTYNQHEIFVDIITTDKMHSGYKKQMSVDTVGGM